MRKYVILIMMIVVNLCGCSFIEKIEDGKIIDQTYYLSTNDIAEYNQISDENAAVIVSQIAMSSVVEVETNITFSYTETSFGFGWGAQSQTKTATINGKASAFFINEEGYLITNAHVVTLQDYENYPDFKYVEKTITINYADSDIKFECEIIDENTSLDLAILKVDSSKIDNLKYLSFFELTNPTEENYKDSNAIKLYYGETVIAIGNALGYGVSVTQGIVSAPLRYFQKGLEIVMAIQTDAAINEGNSGGPLLNKYGSVVGVNSFKIVTDTSEGLNYAIPSYVVFNYIDSQNEEIKYYTVKERKYQK